MHYKIVPDKNSKLYDACQETISNADNPMLAKASVGDLYTEICFIEISDKLKNTPRSLSELSDKISMMQESFKVNFPIENLSIRVYREIAHTQEQSHSVILEYITTSTFRKIFKPDYFKEILKEYGAKRIKITR